MEQVILNSIIFVVMIGAGYLLKCLHILKKQDAGVLSVIIMNLTLPCVFLASSDGIVMSSEILLYVGMGAAANIFMLLASRFVFRDQDPVRKGALMIAASGYDVGNFVLPFAVAFFPGEGVACLCAFNIGNTIMAVGVDYILAGALCGVQSHMRMRELLKNLFSSVSFDVYILILFMASLHLSLPGMVFKIVSSVGAANTFLVMTMIGIKLELSVPRRDAKDIAKILLLRLAGAVLFAAITFCLPIPDAAKKVFAIAYLGPLVSVSSVYAAKMGYKGDLVANANTVAILLSVVLITAALMVLA